MLGWHCDWFANRSGQSERRLDKNVLQYSIEDPLLETEFDDLEFDVYDEPSLLIEEKED